MKFFTFKRNGNVSECEKHEAIVLAKPMHKSELTKTVADLAEIYHVDVDRVLECLMETVTLALKAGRPVILPGFGKFKPRKPRTGSCRNPTTGKKVSPPMRKSICFQPSAIIKQKINSNS